MKVQVAIVGLANVVRAAVADDGLASTGVSKPAFSASGVASLSTTLLSKKLLPEARSVKM